MINKLTDNLFREFGVRIPPDTFKRNIIIPNADEAIETYRKQYNNTDVFTTILQYDSSDIRQANQQGSLYFDFDGETAQNDVKAVIAVLIKQGCFEQSLHLFFSGNKGFHLEIPFDALGIKPNKTLNKIFGSIANELKNKNNLSSLDTAVYDQVRLWRLPNSINSKSGLYKIPLSLEEIKFPLNAIKELAKSARLDFSYKEPQQWTAFADIYKTAYTLHAQVYEAKEPMHLNEAVGVGQGSRDDTMLKLTCSLLKRDYDELEVWSTMQLLNRTYKPPLDDASLTRIFRQAKNYTASEKSSATNSNTSKDTNRMTQDTRGTNGMPKPILLSELSTEQYVISWIWEGFIARGHIALLSALWKAGKSTFIGLLLKAIEHGTEFLGQQTLPCNVLVLTEESKYQWIKRRDELKLQSQIYILSNPFKSKLSYPEWISWLMETKIFCKEKEIGLVVIDTISEFWSVNDENKATEVTSALMPLNYLTEDNIAILLVHHFRKSGGTQGTAARGSGAIGSKVDVLIDFTRYEDKEDTKKRKISAHSRFDETPKEIVIELVDGEYVILGNSGEVKNQEKIEKMLDVFTDFTEDFTVRQVLEKWDGDGDEEKTRRTVQRYIVELIKAGKIEKIEDKIVDGKLVPFYKVIRGKTETDNSASQAKETTREQTQETTHDKSSEHIDIKENVAGNEDKITLLTRERELFEKLQPLDKKSQEYAQLHKEWLLLRIKGEELGLFFSVAPSIQDASVQDGVLVEPMKNKDV